MQLLVKNDIFSIRGNSTVKDANEVPVIRIKGRFFSWTRVKKIYDMNGNFLYKIRNKFWRLLVNSAYVYDSNKDKIAQVKQRIALHSKFIVKGYKDEITVDGDILGWDFTIYRNGQAIGTISRKIVVLSDTFVLDAFDDADAPFLVALVIAIDNIVDNNRN